MNPSIDDAKSMARRLRVAMEARGLATTHSDTLELVAAQLGFRNWNTTSAALNANGSSRPRFTQSIPVMLSLDDAVCRKFYCDFLGFEINFEHRSALNKPVYLGFKRGPVHLHLSPDQSDAGLGSAVMVWMTGVDDYRRQLAARSDGHSIPEVTHRPWGRELAIADPFGNHLRFCEQPANGAAQRRVRLDSTDAPDAGTSDIATDTISFDLVREIGAEFPDVKATADKTGTSLKIGKDILACTAIHKTAEPNSLMVSLGFGRRDALVAENPETFYLTSHYERYPVVLVRLSRVGRADLSELLKEGRKFIQNESN